MVEHAPQAAQSVRVPERIGAAPKRVVKVLKPFGREALSQSQAARIIKDHTDVMWRFGYLTNAGEPVY